MHNLSVPWLPGECWFPSLLPQAVRSVKWIFLEQMCCEKCLHIKYFLKQPILRTKKLCQNNFQKGCALHLKTSKVRLLTDLFGHWHRCVGFVLCVCVLLWWVFLVFFVWCFFSLSLSWISCVLLEVPFVRETQQPVFVSGCGHFCTILVTHSHEPSFNWLVKLNLQLCSWVGAVLARISKI